MCLAAGWGIVFGFAGGSKARIYSAAEPVGSFFGGGWRLLRGRARRWVLPTALAFGRPSRTTTRRRPLARGWCISGYFRGRAGCCGFPGGCTRPSPWISNTSSVRGGFTSLCGWIELFFFAIWAEFRFKFAPWPLTNAVLTRATELVFLFEGLG